jgi:hypothetical protein
LQVSLPKTRCYLLTVDKTFKYVSNIYTYSFFYYKELSNYFLSKKFNHKNVTIPFWYHRFWTQFHNAPRVQNTNHEYRPQSCKVEEGVQKYYFSLDSWDQPIKTNVIWNYWRTLIWDMWKFLVTSMLSYCINNKLK